MLTLPIFLSPSKVFGLVYRITQGDSGKSLTRYSISLTSPLNYLRHNHDQQIFPQPLD
ncbi:hypothetical protein KRR23_21400 [Pseudomonas sp. CVAP|uniref:hypothetical protein n=1 Tax=Pseudomonas sp. CVAP\|nr:hypothetical protein [Pseudomonas sp. CVAP\